VGSPVTLREFREATAEVDGAAEIAVGVRIETLGTPVRVVRRVRSVRVPSTELDEGKTGETDAPVLLLLQEENS